MSSPTLVWDEPSPSLAGSKWAYWYGHTEGGADGILFRIEVVAGNYWVGRSDGFLQDYTKVGEAATLSAAKVIAQAHAVTVSPAAWNTHTGGPND